MRYLITKIKAVGVWCAGCDDVRHDTRNTVREDKHVVICGRYREQLKKAGIDGPLRCSQCLLDDRGDA